MMIEKRNIYIYIYIYIFRKKTFILLKLKNHIGLKYKKKKGGGTSSIHTTQPGELKAILAKLCETLLPWGFFFVNNYKSQTILLVSQDLKLFWNLTNRVFYYRFWVINQYIILDFPIAPVAELEDLST